MMILPLVFAELWLNNLCPKLSFALEYRSSRSEVFCRKGVLRNLAKFTGKHPCQSLTSQILCNFIKKKRLWQRCFPVNFAKFLRTSFLQNTCGGCFLNIFFQMSSKILLGFSPSFSHYLVTEVLKSYSKSFLSRQSLNSSWKSFNFSAKCSRLLDKVFISGFNICKLSLS